MQVLGVDIGGSGIKGAPVDVATGTLIRPRHRISTPKPATPDAVSDAVARMAAHFEWTGPIGCAFPAVIKGGKTMTAANVDDSWIGADATSILSNRTGSPVTLLNDADAAGIAEMRFGAGHNEQGLVFMLTLGTGIGSALFYQGKLVPNTELGHMEIRKKEAERRASARIRKKKGLTWEAWAARLSEFLNRVENLFWPDLFIIGGGVSKKHEKFIPLLETRTRVVPARLFNDAGIVGAALAAASPGPAPGDTPEQESRPRQMEDQPASRENSLKSNQKPIP